MARVDRFAEDRGKVKFRFIEFEMEGGSANLEQTLKSVASAIAGPQRSPAPTKALPSASPLNPEPSKKPNGATVEVETFEEVLDASEDVDHAESKPDASRPKASARYTPPQFMDDLEFDQGTSLKGFVEEFKPSSDNEKYLVISAWFQKHRSTEAIGIHHIYTAFQKMSWRSQKDIAQPFRLMMKKKSFFTSGGRGLFKISHIGLDELPKIKEKKA